MAAMVDPNLWNQPDELIARGNVAYRSEEFSLAIPCYAGAIIAKAGFGLPDRERTDIYPAVSGDMTVPVRAVAQVNLPGKISGLHVRDVCVDELDVPGWDRVFHIREIYHSGEVRLISDIQYKGRDRMQADTDIDDSNVWIASWLEGCDIASERIATRVLGLAAIYGRKIPLARHNKETLALDSIRTTRQICGILFRRLLSESK